MDWSISTPFCNFNPRPPCGGRHVEGARKITTPLFQPTPSLRRATCRRYKRLTLGVDFNPRPPCGGRHNHRGSRWCAADFNPRPPCGGRQISRGNPGVGRLFQPTPSLRRATMGSTPAFRMNMISTHALLAEGDPCRENPGRRLRYFNPRPPCGRGDQFNALYQVDYPDFNPRPPCGGRPAPGSGGGCRRNFNPRPPCGGRPERDRGFTCSTEFQPTPSLRRRPGMYAPSSSWTDFNPRPPCGGRQKGRTTKMSEFKFQPTPSLRRATRIPRAYWHRDIISTHALLAEGDSKVEQ